MPQRLNVAIATYRRPDRLRAAVESVRKSAQQAPAGWRVGVTIVDDDPDGSAANVAASLDEVFDLGCTYVFCGSQNISHARNAGLESAMYEADWVGSIDDDVVVPIDWVRVCAAAVAGEHNAVTGPLIKDFSNGPLWLRREPFDHLGLMGGVDGELTPVCATGNNWINAEFLRTRPWLRFSADLGESGGEDMEFFHRAVGAGLRPVYSLGSAVTETEPASRCTFTYQVRRAFWLGVSEAQIALRLGLAGRLRLLARGIRRAVERNARNLPPERLADRGLRYSLATFAQLGGVAWGCLGLQLRHK